MTETKDRENTPESHPPAEPDDQQSSWRFPKEFWLVNLMELCERAAYYGFFIVLTLYLTQVVGFSDKETGIVGGVFFAGLYLLPPFVGAISDRIGFKRGLLLAFGLLAVGYFFLGVTHAKPLVVLLLAVVMVGGSFIKPLITGTVAKTTNEVNRARGYSLFYWIVNIGAFGGKTVVPSIRQGVGLEYVNFFSAGMAVLALLVVLFLFKPIEPARERKTLGDVIRSLVGILTTPRLMALTLIVSGFWVIQHQLYSTMPKYVIRLLGPSAKPEWLANVNPLVVVIFVVLITQLMKRRRAISSMLVGMLLMPFSAAAMALSTTLMDFSGGLVSFGIVSLHPVTVMMIVGIGIQGLAECFISPRFLEYFSLQAPKGEEGTYLGFSHLHSFISALAAFFMSGYLLDAYCPNPEKLFAGGEAALQVAAFNAAAGLDKAYYFFMPQGFVDTDPKGVYENAHHIWYYFIAIGSTAAVALFIFRLVVNRIDRQAEEQQRKQAPGDGDQPS